MKKLNITKEQYNKSRYFKDKYGKLEYVSESGKLFKTNKGQVLKFKESKKSFDDFGDIDTLQAIHDRELDSMISDGIEEKNFLGIRGLNKGTYGGGEKFLQWNDKELLYDDFEYEIQERFPESQEGEFEAWIHDPRNKKKIKSILPELDWYFNDDSYLESTMKFGKKFTKEDRNSDPNDKRKQSYEEQIYTDLDDYLKSKDYVLCVDDGDVPLIVTTKEGGYCFYVRVEPCDYDWDEDEVNDELNSPTNSSDINFHSMKRFRGEWN